MELLQLYAGAFADLVAAYQRSRPLNDREIVELAGTYCTTWISRLQSLHERRVPAEVWQRFYMHAIALQTVNDFRSRLQGAALRVAAELWDRQTRNAPGTHEVFRKSPPNQEAVAEVGGRPNPSPIPPDPRPSNTTWPGECHIPGIEIGTARRQDANTTQD